MFRFAERSDLESCFTIAKKFVDFYGISYDETSVKAVLEKVVDEGVFIIAYVNDEVAGVIGGLFVHNPWNQEEILFQELFWWVEEKHRGGSLGIKLLFELENSVPTGTKLVMSTLPKSNVKDSTMLKLGYVLKEQAFMKG